MSLRIFIPTAGIGSRLKEYTNNLNKSLVTVDNKPVISHIIDSFPKNAEFVIALGFDGKKVKQVLKLIYPKKKFFFQNINKYKGRGSGLGHTLLSCKKYLQQPFIFVSCDTIFRGNIPLLKENWIGYDNSKLSSSYRKIKFYNGYVSTFYKKNHRPIN